MAVVGGGRIQVGVEKTGKSVTVPNDYRAKLMFYMNSICSVIPDMQNEPGFQRLRDYRNYVLTEDEEECLLHFCLSLSPHVLDDKCLFKVDGENSQNEFYELTAAHTRFLAVDRILIAGQQKRVQKIMTYTHCWMHRYYFDPIRIITDKQEDKLKAKQRAQNPPRLAIAPAPAAGQADWMADEDAEAQRQALAQFAAEKKQREAAEKRQRDAEDLQRREMDNLRRENEQIRRELTQVREQMRNNNNNQRNDDKCLLM